MFAMEIDMSPVASTIAVYTADDNCTAGVCLWKQGGRRYATAVVKASFSLVPNAPMTLRAPRPIERTERDLAAGCIEPGDLAPCLVRPEIWVRGHAWYPVAAGVSCAQVGVALAREGTVLWKKNVAIPVQNDPPAPPYLHAFAPLSRKWPVRKRILGSFDETNLAGSPIKVSDAFDWRYFQAASADQRLDPLFGDEWIRLEAMHSTIFHFDTQLPSATSAVKIFGRMDPFVHGVVVPSGLDTIQIDVDQGVCSLLFRGHTQVPDHIVLDDLRFVAGVGLPGQPMPELEPRLSVQDEPLPEVEEDESILVASFISASTLSGLSALFERSAPLPFREGSSVLATPGTSLEPSRPTALTRSGFEETFAFDPRLLDTLTQRDALPFHDRSSESRSLVPNVILAEKPAVIEELAPYQNASFAQNEQKNGLPLTDEVVQAEPDVGSTFFLSDEVLAALEGQEATPFVGGEELPERDEPVDIWVGLPFQHGGVGEAQATGSLGAIFLALMQESGALGLALQ